MSEIKEILFFSTAPREVKMEKLGFIVDENSSCYVNHELNMTVSKHDVKLSPDWRFSQIIDDAIRRHSEKEAKGIDVKGAETITGSVTGQNAIQIESQRVLYHFEEWCSTNEMEFSPKNMNVFIKSLA